MRSVIAILMAVLGALLVLGGSAGILAAALARTRSGSGSASSASGGFGRDADLADAGALERLAAVASRLAAPDRLIIWGVFLLALSAIASGAIHFSATVNAGTR